ncbi:MAG: alpha/beta hydrolase [Clostridia bacterium]|nr:alpha/beta hydrolase [Clostridia bacterium]
MLWLWIGLGAVLGVILLVLLTALICFFRVFYSPSRKPLGEEEYAIPDGEIYEVHREAMIRWTKMIRTMPHENVSIRSYDGLTLRGRYYEYQPGAPLELLFHGYRGTGERDLSGGVERCFALGRNALIVDHRAAGTSDGHVITFGIKERRDCLDWIAFALKRFGADTKIILTGISMGAATVMMAMGEKLPPNVVCVLADCGYSSPKEIIQKVIRDMKLPQFLYPFIRLGARLYGGFDLEETSPMEAVAKCRVPLILIHGDADDFVPCEMSRRLYEACASTKKFVAIPGAGHGLAFPVNQEMYLTALADFQKECGF